MQNQKMYDWVSFYKECAVKLLEYGAKPSVKTKI